jgi:hypothetical protein
MACMIKFEQRITKLEQVHGSNFRRTWDELQFALLDLLRDILARGDSSLSEEDRAEVTAHIARIEADIAATAAMQASQEYSAHLKWCRAMWGKKTGNKYVMAVTGASVYGGNTEYMDWDAPNIMEKRAALRARQDVKELILGRANTASH